MDARSDRQAYEPIDLSQWCNAGLDALGVDALGQLGKRIFRGLPFFIPNDSRRCFITGGGDGPRDEIVVPLNGVRAFTLVFLHRLLDSNLLQGGQLGRPAAQYVLRFGDGSEARQIIRERFEIGMPHTWIRDLPALALPDQKHELPPRFAGNFSIAGRRATGVVQRPYTFYMWAWRNPKPRSRLLQVSVVPDAMPFLIGGLTLGHVDEHPLVPAAWRPVRIDVPGAAGDLPFELEVDVDRGFASFPYPLPRESPEAFLHSAWAGFGEASILGTNPSEGLGPYVRLQPTSPAYVRISATPSATVTIRQGERVLGQAPWSDVESGESIEAGSAQIKLLDPGRNWVRTTVVDKDSGLPIPCRIHFRAPSGVPYPPHGHPEHVSLDAESWHMDVGGDVRLGRVSYAYIDGRCEGWLPRGEVIVDVARGFEYEPLRTHIEIKPEQRELRVELARWIDLNDKGWFSGDTHVHFVSAAGSHLEAQAEGLNVVNVLITQAGELFSGLEEFEGRPSLSQRGNTVVYVGQENRQHFLGHLSLLGLKEPVFPLSSGGSTEAELGGALETTLAHWADHCHAQGGIVVLPHLPVPNGEPAVLIATGRVDAVEMCEHKMYFHHEYYRYLNSGYRLSLAAGTDKMSSEVPMGLFRTYVYIPKEKPFTFETWCDGLKDGRTFLSSGPIVGFTVEGKPIGSVVDLPSSGGDVQVEATADSIFPIHRLELIERGMVIAEAVNVAGARHLRLNERVRVRSNTWLAVRVGAVDYAKPMLFADAWARGVMAHSSPIYVACGGPWSLFDRSGLEYMTTLTELALSHVQEMRLREKSGTVTHRHGAGDHDAYLEAPFRQALSMLGKRMEANS